MMKKSNLGILVLGLIATFAMSSCAVHTREYNRRPPRHDRHHDDHRDDNHRGNDHYYNRY